YSMMYAPSGQNPRLTHFVGLMVRSTLTPQATIEAVRQTLAAKHPTAISDQFEFGARVREGMVRERLMAMLAGFFGVLAALMTVIGLYGLISYLVARRRHEIGIRLALGAHPRQVIEMVAFDAGRLLTMGLAIGAALTLALGRGAATESLLFKLEP